MIFALGSFFSDLEALPAFEEKFGDEVQIASGVELPHWGDGECREAFDIRIWPQGVVTWLEQENLRELIADPNTGELERQSLKRILALQRAWQVKGKMRE